VLTVQKRIPGTKIQTKPFLRKEKLFMSQILSNDFDPLAFKVTVKSTPEGALLTFSLDNRLLTLLDIYAEQHEPIGKEDKDPLLGRLCALGHLIIDHSSTCSLRQIS
jgi:hypothetical protein